jgi:SAM-dependent methyltransferase
MDKKTQEQLREAYLFKKRLADKLKTSTDRKSLYQEVYEEYYNNFPDHPFVENTLPAEVSESASSQMRVLKKFLNKETDFAELGSGTGAVSLQVAQYVNSVTLIDISDIPTKNKDFPDNARLIISNGINIPDDVKNIDLMYSSQLMEHLHEDDAKEQLTDIWRSLKKKAENIFALHRIDIRGLAISLEVLMMKRPAFI